MLIRRLWFVPFVVGAAGAALLGRPRSLSLVVFVALAAGTLIALRRLVRQAPWASLTAGSQRWQAREAHVIEPIGVGETGWVRLGRERWRASCELDVVLPAGSTVLVTGVRGTRLTVLPLAVVPAEEEEQ